MKDVINKLKAQILTRKFHAILLLVAALTVLLFFLFPNFYNQLLSVYINLLIKGASLLLSITQSHDGIYAFDGYFTVGTNQFLIDTQFVALKYSLLFLFSFFILFPTKDYKQFSNLLFSIFSLYLLNCIRIALLLIYVKSNGVIQNHHHLLFHIILFAGPILVLLLQDRRRFWDFLFPTVNKKSISVGHVTVKLLFVGLILNVISIIISFGIPEFNKWIFDSLTLVILNFSKVILGQFDFIVSVQERYLISNNSHIFMGDPCIGLYVMIVFMIIPFLTNGRLIHKFSFVIIGLFIIIFLNALRIALLFAYMHEPGISQLNIEKWHDIYNQAIYILVFILWVGWYQIQEKLEPNP
jgi:exosortase/archaeosortase family protein